MNAMAQGRAAPATAAAVANGFLDLAEEAHSPLDQMKLQKLLFYAHAWHLAHTGKPLFDEDFEAWPWGPVVRDIYSQTLEYGRGPITGRMLEFGPLGDGRFGFHNPAPLPDELKAYLRSVWESHKGFSGIQLSNSTHAPGEPWTIVKDQIGTSNKPRIPNELIAAVFKQKLQKHAAAAPDPTA